MCKLISEVFRNIHEDGQQASQYEGASQRIPANSAHRGLSSVAFKCQRITQDNPGCLSNSVFKSDIYTKMSDLKG